MPGEHPTTEDDRSALKVLRVTPQGRDVRAGRQIVFQFNRAVVPIGKMDREQESIPVSIRPALGCKWRWLNTSALACQLRESDAMKRATTYNVVMTPGDRTEDGATIGAAVERSFITTRPRIAYTRFANWLSPGAPLIQVTFNQPVTNRSVRRSLSIFADDERFSLGAFPDELPRSLPWGMASLRWRTNLELMINCQG